MCAKTYAERSKEPPVLPGSVSVLQQLFDGLLCVLSLAGLLESLIRDSPFHPLKFQSISSREEVGVVNSLTLIKSHNSVRTKQSICRLAVHLNERFYFAPFG